MLKEIEFSMLKSFNDNLTESEKKIALIYQKTIPPYQNDTERRRNNLMVMAFIEGVRWGRNHPDGK